MLCGVHEELVARIERRQNLQVFEAPPAVELSAALDTEAMTARKAAAAASAAGAPPPREADHDGAVHAPKRTRTDAMVGAPLGVPVDATAERGLQMLRGGLQALREAGAQVPGGQRALARRVEAELREHTQQLNELLALAGPGSQL
jgi:hypothetical protein